MSTPLADSPPRSPIIRSVVLQGTLRPLRPYSVISYGNIQVGKESKAIAIKSFHKIDSTDEKAHQRTHREHTVLAALASSSEKCDNIVHFCGLWFPEPGLIGQAIPGLPSIVTAFVRWDSLDYINRRGREFCVRLSIAQQLANGVRHLHSLNIVHGDIKPDNFRIDDNGVVKIIDFGLSRPETAQHTGMTTLILPCYHFIAPELIIPGQDSVSMFVTKATDVYAFSMTALQVLDGRGEVDSRPFNHCRKGFDTRWEVTHNGWPKFERYPGIPPKAWDVIQACWTSNAFARPTIAALFKSLSAIS